MHDNNSNGSVPSNGILINGGSQNVVRANTVKNNGDAVDSTEQDGGITMRNRRQQQPHRQQRGDRNFGDGISVRSGSFDNKMDGNRRGGTAAPGGRPGSEPLNEWNQNNRCLTQNEEVPVGTCEPDDVPPGEG